MNHINNIADMTEAILRLVSSEGYLPMNLADMMQVMTLEPGDFGLLSDAVDPALRRGRACYNQAR